MAARGKRTESDIVQFSLSGEAVHVADRAVMAWYPQHMCKQLPFFAGATKKKKRPTNH